MLKQLSWPDAASMVPSPSFRAFTILQMPVLAARDALEADGRVGFWNVRDERPIQHPDAILLEQATRWLPSRVQSKPWTAQEDERLKREVMQRARVCQHHRKSIYLALL